MEAEVVENVGICVKDEVLDFYPGLLLKSFYFLCCEFPVTQWNILLFAI